MAEKPRTARKLRVIVPSIVLGIGVVVGLYYGIDYWLYSTKHVVTDDARIKGRMVSVAPEVSGVVRVLHVDEGDRVKAGDILLALQDTDYRLQVQEERLLHRKGLDPLQGRLVHPFGVVVVRRVPPPFDGREQNRTGDEVEVTCHAAPIGDVAVPREQAGREAGIGKRALQGRQVTRQLVPAGSQEDPAGQQ